MSSPISVIYQRHRLTVADYHCMEKTGIFGEDDRIELIEGEIIDMAPVGSYHAGTVNFLSNVLQMAVGMRAIISTQNPIVVSRHSEPQPDLALLKPRGDFYRNGHPTAEDVLLVIEVADKTLRYDQEIKAPLYAQHGIPELWIVDLENRCLRLYRGPSETGYQQEQTIQSSEALASLALLDTSVNLSALFT